MGSPSASSAPPAGSPQNNSKLGGNELSGVEESGGVKDGGFPVEGDRRRRRRLGCDLAEKTTTDGVEADGGGLRCIQGKGPYGQEVTRGQDLTGKDFNGN